MSKSASVNTIIESLETMHDEMIELADNAESTDHRNDLHKIASGVLDAIEEVESIVTQIWTPMNLRMPDANDAEKGLILVTSKVHDLPFLWPWHDSVHINKVIDPHFATPTHSMLLPKIAPAMTADESPETQTEEL